jgi:hypothetical protein
MFPVAREEFLIPSVGGCSGTYREIALSAPQWLLYRFLYDCGLIAEII